MVALISTVVEIANVALLLGLLYIYAQSHLKVKSKFTLGLLFFTFFFLLQGTVAIYFYSIEVCNIAFIDEVRPILSAIETAGLVALLWITWK